MRNCYVTVNEDGKVLSTLKTSGTIETDEQTLEITEEEFKTINSKMYDSKTKEFIPVEKPVIPAINITGKSDRELLKLIMDKIGIKFSGN